MAQKIIRHELVEITIPKGSTLTRYNFPDIPNLRTSHIWALEVYNKNCISKGIITQNELLPISAVLFNSFITLVNYGGKEFLKQAPSTIFASVFSQDISGVGSTINQLDSNNKSFVGQKVNYPKSYIEFSTAPSDPAKDLCFMVSVYYSLPLNEEKAESGKSFSKRS